MHKRAPLQGQGTVFTCFLKIAQHCPFHIYPDALSLIFLLYIFFIISQQMFLAYFLKTFNRYIPYLVCHYVLKEFPYFSGFLNNIIFTYFQTINPNIFLAYFKNISFWQTDEGLGLGWVDWVGRVKYKDNMKCWKSKYEIIITEGAIWREKKQDFDEDNVFLLLITLWIIILLFHRLWCSAKVNNHSCAQENQFFTEL